jgi:hypothetical protein
MEYTVIRATLEGLVRVYPGELPVLRAWLLTEGAAEAVQAAARYGSPTDLPLEDLGRIELEHVLDAVRREVLEDISPNRQMAVD